MTEFPGFTTRTEPLRFEFFFDRLDTCRRKGRGFSLFHADAQSVADFSSGCQQRGLAPRIVQLSSIQADEVDPAEETAAAPFVILIQDLEYADFLEIASRVADRLVFPLWYRRIPICFFSLLGREAYDPRSISGEDLHRDLPGVLRRLLAEQVHTLLERSNYQIPSPDLLTRGERAPETLFTPIEEKMRAAFEAHGLAFQPQVRLGRQTVDFLVDIQGSKVVVECESNAYPASDTSSHGAKGLARGGYPVCTFSAAQIESDVEKCIQAVQSAVQYRTLPSYGLDKDLDPSQLAAVNAASGPVRVLAPAGSGKTRTLVNRILHLLNQGIAPDRILALAFNKKARDEMQERLERRASAERGLEIRTFHSFGYEIVREALGWSFGAAAQKQTARALLRSAIQEHTQLPALRDRDPLDTFMAGLRKAKMELPELSTVTVEYGDRAYPLEPIFHSYVKKQMSASFVDFDDMIYMAVRLLLENSALRRTYQSRFEYVLIDEFQDLNEAQLLLLQIISLPENNVFAVGDDDQMIYGFRGADVKHIVEFEKRFPVTSTYVLNTNYRSSQMIIRHAGWLVSHNQDRVPKDMQPGNDARSGRFEVSGHESLLEQAKYAAAWLLAHKEKNRLNWRDYAILYRYHAYQFPVAVMLDALGIPHTPVATQQLFQTSVGMDVHAYLQVILFPKEASASDFERILRRPNKFITNQLIAQAKDWFSFIRLPQLPAQREWEHKALAEFIGLISRYSEIARVGQVSAADFLQQLKTEFGLGDYYREQSRLTDDLDQASDEGLLDVIIAMAGNYKTPVEFLKYIDKSIRDQAGEGEARSGSENPDRAAAEENQVYLSTIHRAKGREFRNVVYFNLSQATDPAQDSFIEEERRVVYVGATRAKDDLLITFTSGRPSVFLQEMALNPRYREIDHDGLQHELASARLRLERARIVLRQLEEKKLSQFALVRGVQTSFQGPSKLPDRYARADLFFRVAQTGFQRSSRLPGWLQSLIYWFQIWRIDRVLKRVDDIEAEIRAHREQTIIHLEKEIDALQEEEKMRSALFGFRPS
jgi:DNA helicase-2/ATP-dependent DNA helicase PcrA